MGSCASSSATSEAASLGPVTEQPTRNTTRILDRTRCEPGSQWFTKRTGSTISPLIGQRWASLLRQVSGETLFLKRTQARVTTDSMRQSPSRVQAAVEPRLICLSTYHNDCGIVTHVFPPFLKRKSHLSPPSASVIVRRSPQPDISLATLSTAHT
jgi:hypothetical protein